THHDITRGSVADHFRQCLGRWPGSDTKDLQLPVRRGHTAIRTVLACNHAPTQELEPLDCTVASGSIRYNGQVVVGMAAGMNLELRIHGERAVYHRKRNVGQATACGDGSMPSAKTGSVSLPRRAQAPRYFGVPRVVPVMRKRAFPNEGRVQVHRDIFVSLTTKYQPDPLEHLVVRARSHGIEKADDIKHLTAHHLGDEREASRPGNRQCITEIVDTSVGTGAHHYAGLSQRLQLLLDPRVVTHVVR